MGSINFSLAAAVLLSGLLILGTMTDPTEASVCSTMACAQGTYMTCANTPGQYFPGCSCQCAPTLCTGCAVYTPLQG
ncbi:hypothetical protein BAE44_0007806 [Dichanthelium oligosanthes]|uniref:Uncharacterized protein n=1 Tax=Dichanthelium oligosanthes TaxID=888268 RepID=A0A1E5W1B7_9POAL|nr:hypothetical protein BAE44_0007806 [Dichanthelium oligosanthes]